MDGPEPERQLSLLQTSAIIIGTVIGSGVFISLPIVAAIAGSPGMSVAIWFLGGVVWIPQVLILAEMGTAYPVQGGAYLYLHRAGSPFLGFLYTWTAFLTSDTPTLTIIALSAVSAATIFSALLDNPVVARLAAAGLIALIALVHVRSVRGGGNAQVVLTVAKLAPLALIVVWGLLLWTPGALAMAATTGDGGQRPLWNTIIAGVSSTLWSYAGFTNILYMAGEVKNPARVLPVSLLGSLAFVMASYTLIAAATGAIVPFADIVAAKGTFVNPFVYLPGFAGSAGAVFALAGATSMIGALSACMMSQPRLEYAMARDGLFFPAFGHLHPVHRTPDYSILIQAGLAILMLLLSNIENLLGYFTLSYALQNALVYGALFPLRRRRDYAPTYRAPFGRSSAAVALAIQAAVGVGTILAYPVEGAVACLGLILTGFPVYRYYHGQRARVILARGPGAQ
jgi:fructoselysine transporter